MKTTPIASILALAITLVLVPEASADESSRGVRPVAQVADGETPPDRPARTVEAAIDEDAGSLRRSGARLRTAGAVLGVSGTAAATAGLALLLTAGSARSCESSSDGDLAGMLVLLAIAGANEASACAEDPNDGQATIGAVLTAAGAGVAITGAIVAAVGAARTNRALRGGRGPTVEPWIAPTGGGAMGGVTLRH